MEPAVQLFMPGIEETFCSMLARIRSCTDMFTCHRIINYFVTRVSTSTINTITRSRPIILLQNFQKNKQRKSLVSEGQNLYIAVSKITLEITYQHPTPNNTWGNTDILFKLFIYLIYYINSFQ